MIKIILAFCLAVAQMAGAENADIPESFCIKSLVPLDPNDAYSLYVLPPASGVSLGSDSPIFSEEDIPSPATIELIKAVRDLNVKACKTSISAGGDIRVSLSLDNEGEKDRCLLHYLAWVPKKGLSSEEYISRVSEVVRLLNPSLTWKEWGGVPPLVYTLLNKNIDVAKAMILGGVNTDLIGLGDYTALNEACSVGAETIVKMILERSTKTLLIENEYGQLPIHTASHIDSVPLIQLLLEKAPLLINARDDEGRTPLMHALSIKNLKVAKYLIDHGAAINTLSVDNVSPLHLAAQAGSVLLVTDISHKSQKYICLKDKDGKTPLTYACLKNCVLVSKALLSVSEAAVNERDKRGRTPLHYACEHASPVLVELLLSYGAYSTISDNNGFYPEDLVEGPHRLSIVRLLRNHEHSLAVDRSMKRQKV